MLNLSEFNLPLRYVESDERYSTYRDRDGDFVYLAAGTGQRLVFLPDLDLPNLWHDWLRGPGQWSYSSGDFTEYVSDLLVDPDEADDMDFCEHCCTLVDDDSRHFVDDGHTMICDSCVDNYSRCESCEKLHADDSMTSVGEDVVCRSCFQLHCHYCDHCGQAAWDEEGCDNEHETEDGCDCESPAQRFSVRNTEVYLAEDERVQVSLPSGVISDEGINEIQQFLRDPWIHVGPYGRTDDDERERKRLLFMFSSEVGEMDPRWQTKQGNFTKRLSRLAHQKFALKISPQEMSQIGNIARAQSTPVDVLVEVTRDLNQSAEMFCHEDSCWWQSYSASRCALKSNGGFGLRSFGDMTCDYPTGRAWVMPLKLDVSDNLTPTFNTEKPDAFVVFNGYDDLEGYTPARIVSHMAGMTYRKVGLSVPGMYVNNDTGYLIAPEEIAKKYTDGRLCLEADTHSNLFDYEQTEKEMVLSA